MKLSNSLEATKVALLATIELRGKTLAELEEAFNRDLLQVDGDKSRAQIRQGFLWWYEIPFIVRDQVISYSFNSADKVGGYWPYNDSHLHTLVLQAMREVKDIMRAE